MDANDVFADLRRYLALSLVVGSTIPQYLPDRYASIHEQIVDATAIVASQANECRRLAWMQSAEITSCFDLILESISSYTAAREELLGILD